MKNDYGITRVDLKCNIKAHCPLGRQWYDAEVNIEVEYPSKIPDYIEFTEEVEKFDGCTLTIEELCSNIHAIANESFMSSSAVSVSVGKGKHMPITVRKEG